MEPAVRCHLIRAAGTPPIIVWVVDDSADDDLYRRLRASPRARVPSPNFWGVWGAGKHGDADIDARLRLIDRARARSIADARGGRGTSSGHRCSSAILEIPHIVVVQPREIADALKLSDATSADVHRPGAIAARRNCSSA